MQASHEIFFIPFWERCILNAISISRLSNDELYTLNATGTTYYNRFEVIY